MSLNSKRETAFGTEGFIMLIIDKISFTDLPQLAELYKQLLQEESNIQKMGEVYKHISNNDNHYLLGAKTGDGELVGSVMGIVCLDLCMESRPLKI
ncbi:MAG: hypothetical protein GY754_46830 [bacterium]|nr:hypothetical protein [bacterium]